MSNFFEDEETWGKSQLYEELKKNTGICADCGKEFEQGYKVDKKTGIKKFNHYKYCPKCRAKILRNKEEKTKSVKIKYDPYPWQAKFHASKARCKVISGAARTGKDRSCTMEFTDKFVEMLNEDRDYTYVPKVHGWIIAPTFRLAGQLLREIKLVLQNNRIVSVS